MLFREAILHVSMLALSCIFGKGRSSQETNLFWGRLWKSGHENLRVGSQQHHEQMGRFSGHESRHSTRRREARSEFLAVPETDFECNEDVSPTLPCQ
jgi:hypothetical protein